LLTLLAWLKDRNQDGFTAMPILNASGVKPLGKHDKRPVIALHQSAHVLIAILLFALLVGV
jgi:hypothetical protein